MIKNQYFLNDYVPKKYDGAYNVLKEYKEIREKIWAFKDGNETSHDYFLDKVASKIEEIKLLNKDKEVVIIPVPASNSIKSSRRFVSFLSKVCTKTRIKNGYGFISSENHNAAHLGGARINTFKLNNASFITSNTIIVIFDDVFTSGSSFNTAASLFPNYDVYGLFLGKTIDSYQIVFYISEENEM
ncbi:hypothetical protein [Fusobacterium sp. THCT1E2]